MKENNQRTDAYFDALRVETRYLDGKRPDPSFSLFGERFRTPVMAALFSGEITPCDKEREEVIRGAALAGAVNWVLAGEKEEMEKAFSLGAKTILIFKPYADNDLILDRMAYAQSCGAFAVGIDISGAFDERGAYAQEKGAILAPKSAEEIEAFVKATSLPFLVKGVLSARDAYKAWKAGAQGIMASACREMMDYAVSPLRILPEILQAVNGQIPVFVEGKVVGGQEAFKALALGAAGVTASEEKMQTCALESGAAGVCRVLTQISEELKGVMAGTGCYDLAHMDQTVIHQI